MKVSRQGIWSTVLLLLLIGVWLPPLRQTFVALSRAISADVGVGSIDSGNDVWWNQTIGVGYIFLAAAAGLTIVCIKPIVRLRYVPIAIGFLAAAFFNRFPYDTMIIIAPERDPRLPAFLAFFSSLSFLVCLALQLKQASDTGQEVSRFTLHVSR